MAKKSLYRADVVAVLQKMGREGMAERMAGDTLRDGSSVGRLSHRALHDRLVEMMPPDLAALGIAIGPRRREDPLP